MSDYTEDAYLEWPQEIDQLKRRIAELEGALEEIAGMMTVRGNVKNVDTDNLFRPYEIAIAALNKQQGGGGE